MAGKKKQIIRQKPEPMAVLAQIYLGLLATVFVLYPGFRGYVAIDQAKYRCFLVLTGGYVGLSLLLLAEMTLLGDHKPADLLRWFRQTSWTQRLVLAYLALTLLAAIVSPHQEAWIGMSRKEGFWTICLYCLSFLLISAHGQYRRWMLHVLGASMTAFCLLSVWQLLGGNPLQLYPEGLNYYDAGIAYSGAYLGTAGNADVTSALLALVIPLFAIGIWKGTEKNRFWLLLPMVLCLTVLLWCGVAAGYVALAGGLLLTVPALLREKRVRVAAWCGAGMLCLLALLLLWLWEPSGGTLREFHLLLRGQAEDSFGSGRIRIWKQVWALAKENLLFGTGPDTLAAAGLEGFTRYDESLNALLVAQIDLAHNEYLQILVSQGLPALLAYLGALGCTAILWVRKAHANPVLAACGAAVLWYCIQVFFGFSLLITAPLFWAIWALAEKEIKKENPIRRT